MPPLRGGRARCYCARWPMCARDGHSFTTWTSLPFTPPFNTYHWYRKFVAQGTFLGIASRGLSRNKTKIWYTSCSVIAVHTSVHTYHAYRKFVAQGTFLGIAQGIFQKKTNI